MNVVTDRWSKAGLGSKLAISNFLLVAFALLACVVGIGYGVSKSIESRAISELTAKTTLLSELIEGSDQDLRMRTATLAKAFRVNLQGKIELTTATVAIKDQIAPIMKLDGRSVNLDFQLVDHFTEATSAVATVFVRKGDDFIRVTTSLKNDKGERAIGTLLDRGHPGYSAVLSGKSFTGLATLFGRQYMTQYDPIKDVQGVVIGLSFIGLDFSDYLKALKDTIRKVKIGDTGYFYVLDARPGPTLGSLIVHPASEGKNLLAAKDPSGREFIKDILEQKQGVIRYPWINKELGETSPRDKVVSFTYLKNWKLGHCRRHLRGRVHCRDCPTAQRNWSGRSGHSGSGDRHLDAADSQNGHPAHGSRHTGRRMHCARRHVNPTSNPTTGRNRSADRRDGQHAVRIEPF
jgi:methyl-accepting chemotaxis protein